MRFIPDNFKAQEKLITDKFIIRKLCAKDVYLDYFAVMSSLETIKKTRGGSWPTQELTFENDFIDLAWHQREFENKSSFAFTIMNLGETECLGCLYLYPPGFRCEAPEGSDVDVSFWVTQKEYEKGLYKELYVTLKNWLEKDWTFKKPFWSNAEIPNLQ